MTASSFATTKSRCATPTATASTQAGRDRKSTRLNSSHVSISYAVFCLKKKKRKKIKNRMKQQTKNNISFQNHTPDQLTYIYRHRTITISTLRAVVLSDDSKQTKFVCY